MAKGYSARGGFSGGGSAMRQQQMQQKLLKMQQDMAAAQEAVENASFTASVGGGVVQATVSGKKELTALTVKPEAVDPEDVEMLQDLVISAVNEALRQADEAMNSSMQSFTGGLNLPGFGLASPEGSATAGTGNRSKTQRADTPFGVSARCFCHGKRIYWAFLSLPTRFLAFPSPVCFSARFVIASVLFGTFCYRQCAFRHILLSPAHLFGTICHGRYVFPVLLVIVNMAFRCCL